VYDGHLLLGDLVFHIINLCISILHFLVEADVLYMCMMVIFF